jgi:hypothetical protein
MNSRDDIWDDYAVRAEVERQAAKQDAETTADVEQVDLQEELSRQD